MRMATFLILGLLGWRHAAPAQTLADNVEATTTTAPDAGSAKTGVVGATGSSNPPSYAPLTTSERVRLYVLSAFGPGAIARAAAAAGITQWTDTPKEWKQGSEAFGERFGNYLAERIIEKTLESGAAAALHEDNRYFKSTDTAFGKRLKHAVFSAFIARDQAGREHLSYSRIGATLGSSLISRLWQPRSEDSAGAAAVNFGATMGVDIGWNVFREFRPKRLGRRF